MNIKKFIRAGNVVINHHGMKRLLPVLMGVALLLLSSTEGWSLPPCEESPIKSNSPEIMQELERYQYVRSVVKSWNNCLGTHTLSFRSKGFQVKYSGVWKNGKPNGQGTQTFSNGGKYVGEHKDGKEHGHGTYTYPTGSKMISCSGEFKNRKRHGYGTCTWRDGFKYVGEWKNNHKNGKGTATRPDGSKYVGEWKDGKRNGKGIFTTADSRVKEGIWENDKFLYAKQVSPTVTAKNSSSDELRSRLLQVKRLESKGLITKEEAASKRQELLDKL